MVKRAQRFVRSVQAHAHTKPTGREFSPFSEFTNTCSPTQERPSHTAFGFSSSSNETRIIGIDCCSICTIRFISFFIFLLLSRTPRAGGLLYFYSFADDQMKIGNFGDSEDKNTNIFVVETNISRRKFYWQRTQNTYFEFNFCFYLLRRLSVFH